MERGLPGVIERGGCSLRPARPPERRKRSFVRCGGYECTEFFSCEEEEKEGDMREVLCRGILYTAFCGFYARAAYRFVL
jgi:hypothetical protein